MRHALWAVMLGGCLSGPPQRAWAAESPIAARVGDATITVAAVDAIVDRLPGRTGFSPAAVTRLRAETLAQLVNKSLVIAYLDGEKFLPNEQPWEARWVRYLATQITDDDVRKFFEQHKKEFDGTELRVSHILLRLETTEDEPAAKRVVEQAQQLRQRIASGEVTFAAAATQHSAGPSRDRGGDLGWINRRGPMVESFSRAAFALERGAISEPVQTPFGVHLIQCTEIKPGKLGWEQANREVREVLSARLLQRLADEQRRRVKIEYTGAAPYLDSAGNVAGGAR